MITDPDTFAPLFIEAGADQVSVHYEAATYISTARCTIFRAMARRPAWC